MLVCTLLPTPVNPSRGKGLCLPLSLVSGDSFEIVSKLILASKTETSTSPSPCPTILTGMEFHNPLRHTWTCTELFMCIATCRAVIRYWRLSTSITNIAPPDKTLVSFPEMAITRILNTRCSMFVVGYIHFPYSQFYRIDYLRSAGNGYFCKSQELRVSFGIHRSRVYVRRGWAAGARRRRGARGRVASGAKRG